GAPSAVHDARLSTVPAQSAKISYRELFLEPEPMRRALQRAVNGFRTQRPTAPMTGEALRSFLESDLAYADALAYLNKLALLLDEVEQLNLSEREPGDTRLVLLEKLRLMGIDVEALDGAIRAAAANDSSHSSLKNAG
ncbi:MAG: hypothetical protein O7B23_02675, partial [Deltaproteobacteria bacterium]|nr:hypothetical protein [Deltaproteobacteria bacterium]